MNAPEVEGFHPTLLNVHVFCIKGSIMKTARFSFSAVKGAGATNVEDLVAALGYQFNHS